MTLEAGKYLAKPIKHDLIPWVNRNNNNSAELRVEVTFQITGSDETVKWSGFFHTDKSAEAAIKTIQLLGYNITDRQSVLKLSAESGFVLNADRDVELVVEMTGNESRLWPTVKWINVKPEAKKAAVTGELLACLDKLTVFKEPQRKETVTSHDGLPF
jgi:hypothetical protein